MILALSTFLYSNGVEAKEVFKTYCWGCHHESAEAFGPSFSEIANKRTKDEIAAYIIDPKAMYEAFGYKRSVMTEFNLSDKEIEAVVNYILLQKDK